MVRFLRSSLGLRSKLCAAFIAGAMVGACLVLAISSWYFKDRIEPITAALAIEKVERSIPVHISVPSVGIEADFEEPLGIDPKGEMTVPKGFDTVGWYRYSPTPGELGPAVVLGHVDSQAGPEVFHPLKDIKDNDLIKITREDGSVAVFSVYEVDYYSQRKFPSDKVYGDTKLPELRLITCAGIFNKGSHRYSHNLVVYARLLEFSKE